VPNDQTVDYDWSKYRVPAKQIEKLTGYKLFPSLPEEVATAIKESADDVKVRVPRPRKGTEKE
jgi:DNA/RNA endonuclease G (NUC1)